MNQNGWTLVLIWAPDVTDHNGLYHMYLTYVPGMFNNLNHSRNIIHLTSNNLVNWEYESTLQLANNDASVCQLPRGTWRLWYNNEKKASLLTMLTAKICIIGKIKAGRLQSANIH